jgi:hypothetical protein
MTFIISIFVECGQDECFVNVSESFEGDVA